MEPGFELGADLDERRGIVLRYLDIDAALSLLNRVILRQGRSTSERYLVRALARGHDVPGARLLGHNQVVVICKDLVEVDAMAGLAELATRWALALRVDTFTD